jgi:hypothetical protein
MPPFIDEIDLTLSPSPEPEPRPRPRHPAQQTPRARFPPSGTHAGKKPFKSEPGEPSRNRLTAGAMSNRKPQAQRANPAQPRINSAHLASIINTSDSQALRSVMIELCKCSPALSGAVVRGLAPHSSFAQSLIRQHAERTIPTSTVKRERFKQERVKQEREASPPLSDSGSSDLVSISEFFGSAVKKERGPSPAVSDGSSSDAFSDHMRGKSSSSRMPGSFHQPLIPHPHRTAPQQRPEAEGSKPSLIRGNRTGSFQPATPRKPLMRVCKNCNEQFVEGSERGCFFHPGRKSKTSNSAGQPVVVWTCCDGDQWDAPCASGDHVGLIVSALDSLKRERSNSDRMHFPDRSLKNPKLR